MFITKIFRNIFDILGDMFYNDNIENDKRDIMVKIKDIAEHLHVSVSTVSKALNGATDVSEETRKAILAYASECGLTVKDRLAFSGKRLCVIYENVDTSNRFTFMLPFTDAFVAEAKRYGCEVVITNTESIPPQEDFDNFMKHNNFAGATIIGLNYSSRLLPQLKTSHTPCVLFDNIVSNEKTGTIGVDSINSVSALVEHLIEAGHTRIGFLGSDKFSLVSGERLAGYILGLNRHNINVRPDYTFWVDKYAIEEGERAAEYYADKKCTAIVCSSDIIAIGLIRGLQNRNLRVPKDIAVTGFDDLEVASILSPSLTTIKQNFSELGKIAFNQLRSIIVGEHAQRILLDGEMIVRESTQRR